MEVGESEGLKILLFWIRFYFFGSFQGDILIFLDTERVNVIVLMK